MKNNKFNIITSFPKSGNTWMRFIIYDLLFNDHDKIIENSSEIDQFIPDTHMQKKNQLILDSRLKNKEVFVKTHSSYSQMSALPIGKIILIIRNPLDVLVSLFNFYEIEKKDKSEMIDFFCTYQTLPFLKKAKLPNWQEHIESWINSGKKHHIVKYSDLIDDFDNQIKYLCNFLDIEITNKKIDLVKRNTSFYNLKKIEIRERKENIAGFFSGSMSGKKTYFMNKGGYGNYKSLFNSSEILKLENSFKKNKWIS